MRERAQSVCPSVDRRSVASVNNRSADTVALGTAASEVTRLVLSLPTNSCIYGIVRVLPQLWDAKA